MIRRVLFAAFSFEKKGWDKTFARTEKKKITPAKEANSSNNTEMGT